MLTPSLAGQIEHIALGNANAAKVGPMVPLLHWKPASPPVHPSSGDLSMYGTSTPSCTRSTWTELVLEPFYKCDKESACQCRNCRRWEFDPWGRKIPWRRKWQPTPVVLPGESYGQMHSACCQACQATDHGVAKSRTQLNDLACTHVHYTVCTFGKTHFVHTKNRYVHLEKLKLYKFSCV